MSQDRFFIHLLYVANYKHQYPPAKKTKKKVNKKHNINLSIEKTHKTQMGFRLIHVCHYIFLCEQVQCRVS